MTGSCPPPELPDLQLAGLSGFVGSLSLHSVCLSGLCLSVCLSLWALPVSPDPVSLSLVSVCLSLSGLSLSVFPVSFSLWFCRNWMVLGTGHLLFRLLASSDVRLLSYIAFPGLSLLLAGHVTPSARPSVLGDGGSPRPLISPSGFFLFFGGGLILGRIEALRMVDVTLSYGL